MFANRCVEEIDVFAVITHIFAKMVIELLVVIIKAITIPFLCLLFILHVMLYLCLYLFL